MTESVEAWTPLGIVLLAGTAVTESVEAWMPSGIVLRLQSRMNAKMEKRMVHGRLPVRTRHGYENVPCSHFCFNIILGFAYGLSAALLGCASVASLDSFEERRQSFGSPFWCHDTAPYLPPPASGYALGQQYMPCPGPCCVNRSGCRYSRAQLSPFWTVQFVYPRPR